MYGVRMDRTHEDACVCMLHHWFVTLRLSTRLSLREEPLPLGTQ